MTKKKILVVEDQNDTRITIREWIASWGHEVVDVPFARDAECLGYDWDFAISDMRLETATAGLELLIKCKKYNPKIKTILITGYDNKGWEAGAVNLYMKKPLDWGALRAYLSGDGNLDNTQELDRRLCDVAAKMRLFEIDLKDLKDEVGDNKVEIERLLVTDKRINKFISNAWIQVATIVTIVSTIIGGSHVLMRVYVKDMYEQQRKIFEARYGHRQAQRPYRETGRIRLPDNAIVADSSNGGNGGAIKD